MSERKLLVVFLVLFTIWTFPVPVHSIVVGVGPNVDVTAANDANNRQQVEPTIAVDPRNSSIIVAGAQDLRLVANGEHRWHGYYRSTDDGRTWSVSLLPGFPGDTSSQGLASPLHGSNATSDPVLAFDHNGNVYFAGLVFNITQCCGIGGLTVFVAKYVNDGADYASTTLVEGANHVRGDDDKPWIAVDDSGGPGDGNVYVAFDGGFRVPCKVLCGLPVVTTLFASSTDGGTSFSAPIPVPAIPPGRSTQGLLPGVTVDPSGSVLVSTVNSTSRGSVIDVSRLTNGGSFLAGTTVATTTVGIPSPLPGANFRSGTVPQIASDASGTYLVWDDFRTGDSDILLAKATDGGTAWSAPTRVNDVTTGQQFFPTIATSGGIVSVAWYDSRLNTGTNMTSLDVFYAQSVNAGVSFLSSVRVTSVSFNPNIVLRTDPPDESDPFMGDYIQIASSPTEAHPVWTDNRNACDNISPTLGCLDQDVFTSTITVNSLSPDFSLAASPTSLTVSEESSANSSIALTSLHGFTGSIVLSASVSPSPKQGPSATLTSATLVLSTGGSASVVLTVAAKGSTPLGTYTITVKASSGSISHTTTVSLTIVSEHQGK